MEAGHDAPIVAQVEQDTGSPRAPLAADDAAAGDGAAVPPPSPGPSPPASSAALVTDEEEWQMITPGGSPRSHGSAHSSLTSEEGHAEERPSDSEERPSDSEERQSECSESGAQAELHSLELADSILGSRADSGAPGLSRPAGDDGAAAGGGGDALAGLVARAQDARALAAAAVAAAVPAEGGGADGEAEGADAPATPTASSGSSEIPRGAAGVGVFERAFGGARSVEVVAAAAPCGLAPLTPAAAGRGGAAPPAPAGGAQASAALAALRGAGVVAESQLAALGRWVLESFSLLARGAREGGGAVHDALCAAAARIALALPRSGKDGAGGVDWRTVLLGGGFAVSAAAAVFFFCRSYRLGDELHKRDRELAKLVVRIMSLQEVLSAYRRPPLARYTHHTTTTTHAAVTGFAHSMACL
ncbi:MAG: hypothetical protein J3K34DRAFT_526580 [Monoraphidium minutum]|nr:MAG: hypothetical protein J3K34DRAFT_526580 [Monoraphidium minutum]